ncbi:MAG: hypothetical protein AB7O98_02820 [Hyphomonadaceae bacterium]
MAIATLTKTNPPPADEDFCLPGLELQHEMHLSLRHWESVGFITQRLSDAGAEVSALSMSNNAGAFVLKCRIKAISSAHARAFVDGLGNLIEGAASVEHLMLAKTASHAGA